eukprot:3246653-Rhodomonas_salina.1
MSFTRGSAACSIRNFTTSTRPCTAATWRAVRCDSLPRQRETSGEGWRKEEEDGRSCQSAERTIGRQSQDSRGRKHAVCARSVPGIAYGASAFVALLATVLLSGSAAARTSAKRALSPDARRMHQVSTARSLTVREVSTAERSTNCNRDSA